MHKLIIFQDKDFLQGSSSINLSIKQLFIATISLKKPHHYWSEYLFQKGERKMEMMAMSADIRKKKRFL